MAEETKKFNQDENDNDVPHLSEDEVSKDKTEEGFIPTHDELIALAKYWSLKILESRWLFDFIHPTAASDIQAERVFANGRINRIRKMVGDEKVDKAWQEVRNDFMKSMTDELWAIFMDGHGAQRAAVAEEAHAIVSGDKKRLASLTHLAYPEIRSPDRAKEIEVRLTPKELADLDAASRRLETSPADILREGAALYIQARNAERKS